MIKSFENLAFYRGLSGSNKLVEPFIKAVRKDRKPRNFSLPLHNEADAWFLKKFGIKYRSQALFLTGSRFIAQGYASDPSNVVRIIPIGEYTYCWSPQRKDLLFYDTVKEKIKLQDYLDGSDYQEDNLVDAAASGHEVMLCCDRYIAIPVELLEEEEGKSHHLILTP